MRVVKTGSATAIADASSPSPYHPTAARAVVRTGERTPYGNVILASGVTF